MAQNESQLKPRCFDKEKESYRGLYIVKQMAITQYKTLQFSIKGVIIMEQEKLVHSYQQHIAEYQEKLQLVTNDIPP